jgi:hypothetical protein
MSSTASSNGGPVGFFEDEDSMKNQRGKLLEEALFGVLYTMLSESSDQMNTVAKADEKRHQQRSRNTWHCLFTFVLHFLQMIGFLINDGGAFGQFTIQWHRAVRYSHIHVTFNEYVFNEY